jgi:hypothetical protein
MQSHLRLTIEGTQVSIRQLYGHDEDLAAKAISAIDLSDWCKAIRSQPRSRSCSWMPVSREALLNRSL